MEQYTVKHLIGKGRTGGVYQAEDSENGNMVAMRRFYDDNGNTAAYKNDVNFIDIIQKRAEIEHPNLANILHGGVDEDGPFIITELIVGEDLHAFLDAHHHMEGWQGIQLAKQILDVFTLLHKNALIHGSLGPSSIIARPDPDTGLHFVILDTSLNEIVASLNDDKNVQQRGANIVMQPPELLHHEPPTNQTDLYMLGQILYYMLSGAHPFAGFSKKELLLALEDGMPPLSKRRPDLDPEFSTWVDRLVSPAKKDRPDSAETALQAFNTFSSRPAFALPEEAIQTSTPQEVNVPTNQSPIRAIRALPPLTTEQNSHSDPEPVTQHPPAPKSSSSKILLIITIFILIGCIIYYLLFWK